MMDQVERQSWLEQIAAYQDGTLGNDAFEQFERALQDDAEKRDVFISVHEQSVGVMEVLRASALVGENNRVDAVGDVVEAASRQWLAFSRAMSHPTQMLAIALAISILLGLGWWAIPYRVSSSVDSSDGVATVTYDDQAIWQSADNDDLSRPAMLSPAIDYRLRSGITRIKMRGGAIVSMSAPANFRLVDGHELHLDSGKMAVRLPNDESDLTVQVGDLRVRDLGTSFGITAAPQGRVDVAVFDGKVSVTDQSRTATESELVFTEGQAFTASTRRLIKSGVAFEPERYQDIWPLTVGVNELSNVIDFVVPGNERPLEDLKNDHKLFLIPERLGSRLDQTLELSLIQPGQTWPRAKARTMTLASGQTIHSYLLAYQPASSRFAKSVALSGSVQFERRIVGVAVTRSQLESTDKPFGLDSIDYSSIPHRRLEEDESERGELPADTISIDTSGHRLFFNLHVGAGKDHLRVLVRGD